MADETHEEEPVMELARRLAAAFLSYRFDVGMDYYYKKNLEGQQMGSFWVELAEQLQRSMWGYSTKIKIEDIEPLIKPIKLKSDIS
jgi:hypothetical protein